MATRKIDSLHLALMNLTVSSALKLQWTQWNAILVAKFSARFVSVIGSPKILLQSVPTAATAKSFQSETKLS